MNLQHFPLIKQGLEGLAILSAPVVFTLVLHYSIKAIKKLIATN